MKIVRMTSWIWLNSVMISENKVLQKLIKYQKISITKIIISNFDQINKRFHNWTDIAVHPMRHPKSLYISHAVSNFCGIENLGSTGKSIWANYEQLLKVIFHVFMGWKIFLIFLKGEKNVKKFLEKLIMNFKSMRILERVQAFFTSFDY